MLWITLQKYQKGTLLQSKKKNAPRPMAVDGSNEEVYGCTPGSCEGFITVLFDGRNPAPDM